MPASPSGRPAIPEEQATVTAKRSLLGGGLRPIVIVAWLPLMMEYLRLT